jgi:glycosyltransferase involved in cell wall biosynthesis
MHICHLSLLNPAVHSRIFFKMATAQVQEGYRVTIIAQDAARSPYMLAGVQIIPLPLFRRKSWRRIWTVYQIARIARRLQADVYQVHTIELLPMARKLKERLPRAKVVYDMHEDYVANILYADYYGAAMRKVLAAKVKAIQDAFPKWGDGLILAEDCFEGLIAFDPDRTATVRNKFEVAVDNDISHNVGPQGLPFMLLTGTIAENWGLWEAIELWQLLNGIQPLGLVIAGHGQDRNLLRELELRVKASGLEERFLLVGGDTYLPFVDVEMYIRACTFGVALYRLRKNIKDRIPTKFYEFMAHRKPLLFTSNPKWDALNAQFDFGMSTVWPCDSNKLAQIGACFLAEQPPFYRQSIPAEAWSWQCEKHAMLGLIQKLIT